MADQTPVDVDAIRARLDATSPGMTVDVHAGGSTLRATGNAADRPGFVGAVTGLVGAVVGETGPLQLTFADDEDGQDATFALHAAADLRRLLDENARLSAELHGRRNLGVEYERLRVENIQLRDQLAAVRKIKPQRRNSAMVTSEQLATMRGWNDAVDEIRAALNPCECGMTDPSTWTTYGGATEPGSMYEWNPGCPAHGAESIEETAQPGAGDADTPGTGSGRGTGVAEAPGTAQADEGGTDE